MYIAKFESDAPKVRICDVPSGTLAIALDEFTGELFYKNVAGIVGISRGRYWPSEHMKGTYQPCFFVRVLKSGEVLTITKG